MNLIKNYTLPVLVLLSGIFLSTISAYYSILGLVSIFSGSALLITLMGISLEVGKIASCLWLHKHWNDKIGFLKVYLSVAVVVLMIITSLGVYGFLTKANLKQSEGVNLNVAKVTALENNISREQSKLDLNSQQINQYNELLSKLITKDVRRASSERKRIQSEIKVLTKESKEIAKTIDNLNTELLPYKSEINAVEVEVGTLLYISKLIYGEDYKEYLPQTLTVLTLLIIFVFDPLAIGLLIASQKSFRMIPTEKRDLKRTDNFPVDDGIRLDVSPEYRNAIDKRKETLRGESALKYTKEMEESRQELSDIKNNRLKESTENEYSEIFRNEYSAEIPYENSLIKEPNYSKDTQTLVDNIVNNNESLGDEFQKVLDDNRRDLYERTELPKDDDLNTEMQDEDVNVTGRMPKRHRQNSKK